MEIHITQTTKRIGFRETTQEVVHDCPGFSGEMQERTGVQSWDRIPEDIRKNGRETVGRLHSDFSGKDLFADDDFAACLAVLAEAKNRTKTEIKIVTRVI
jgi:hypothetical protein